jgi:EpsD family peptidyl-prolyl cis-trans isomerase
LLLGVLGACDGGFAPNVAEPIAAKVNGKPIPVSRLADSNEHGARPRNAAAGVLERLIDQELLVQAALQAKLDRDPRVARMLESARREILAHAYVEGVAAEAGEVSPREVQRFYERNPALFASRRIYRFQEITLEAPVEKVQAVQERVRTAVDAKDLAAWLKAQGLSFSIAGATKPAEQIPLNFLPRLADMNEGEFALIPNPSGASIVQLVEAREAPLSEEQAAPVITRFLASRRRLELAQEAVSELRGKARIEYVGAHRPGTPGAPQGSTASAPAALLTEVDGSRGPGASAVLR